VGEIVEAEQLAALEREGLVHVGESGLPPVLTGGRVLQLVGFVDHLNVSV